MSATISISSLTSDNFSDYESLTSCEGGGGCYCAFWHGKWTSMAEWDRHKTDFPLENRDLVRQKLRHGSIAGITCITIAPQHRHKKLQAEILRALKEYGRSRGWTALEGYPFDEAAHERHGDAIAWPGSPSAFTDAGFTRIEPHWLDHPDYPRSIFRAEL